MNIKTGNVETADFLNVYNFLKTSQWGCQVWQCTAIKLAGAYLTAGHMLYSFFLYKYVKV